ncbi:MAG: hypothetical protein ACOYNL_10135, partial [Rickettsiales bacterium]
MNKSDQTLGREEQPVRTNHGLAVLRVMVSAAIFGALGAWLGKWIGAAGDDERTKMTQSIMKWGMGLFSTVLATYSS